MENISQSVEKLNFSEVLKQATTKAHIALETLPLSSSMMKENITILEYQHYLQAMFQVINEVENRVFPELSEVFSDLKLRYKNQLIANDLKKTNLKPIHKSTRVFKLEDASIPFMVGVLYVVEGSTLGGRYMLKNIESNINFAGESATSFLAGYGNKTGSMWKTFIRELSEFESYTNSSSEIIAGANHAFEAIYDHFLNFASA